MLEMTVLRPPVQLKLQEILRFFEI